jgi:tetratricopeptide (TPR) repeat protein
VWLALAARVMASRGRADEAERLLIEAMEVDRRAHGPASVEVAQRQAAIGRFVLRQGRVEDALGWLETAVGVLRRALPMEHAALHVVMGATHCFDLSLVDKVERVSNDEAIEMARRLARGYPQSPEALSGLAQVAANGSLVTEAMQTLAALGQLRALTAEEEFLRLRLLASTGDYDSVLKALGEPTPEEVPGKRLLRVQVLISAGDEAAARKARMAKAAAKV